jgi:EAL domain-containing protein (putative c-di-GMP-specific phosphodiesterase class I)
MANSLGMRTVAEGVETEAQLEFLRQRGCDAMQGYLVAKPLSAAEFAAFVRGRD